MFLLALAVAGTASGAPPLAPERADLLLDRYLEAADGKPAEEALRSLLGEKGSLDDWEAAIRRYRPPPPSRVSPEGETITLTLPDRKTVRCLVNVPPDYDGTKPVPLLIAGHGTGEPCEAPQSRWWQHASRAGYLLACPDFPLLPSVGGVDRGWMFDPKERAAILAALDAMKCRFNVDEDRVYLTGMSKGGHAAWDVGLRFPHLFAGIVPECSRPYNHGLPPLTPGFDYLENGRDLPVCHLQGDGDHPPMVEAVREACRRLKELGGDVTYLELKGRPHGAYADQYLGALEWMGRHAREPLPHKAFCRCHDLRYARRAWIEITRFDGEVLGENSPLHLSPGMKQPLPEAFLASEEARVLKHSALLDVEVAEPNHVVVRTEHVRELVLHVPDGLFDLSKPVCVTVNGRKAFEGSLAPSVEILLRTFARDRDRRRLVIAEIKVRPS
jgi:dienelactone hydrolase